MSETKKIKDYLHLYIGQYCHISAFEDIPNVLGKLNKVDIGDGITIVIEDPIRKGRRQEFSFELYEGDLENVKLILRPLSLISDMEALKVAEILGGASHLTPKSRISQVKYLLAEIHNKQTNIPGINWAEFTHYMIKQGFDLFGLIDSKLALNQADLN